MRDELACTTAQTTINSLAPSKSTFYHMLFKDQGFVICVATRTVKEQSGHAEEASLLARHFPTTNLFPSHQHSTSLHRPHHFTMHADCHPTLSVDYRIIDCVDNLRC